VTFRIERVDLGEGANPIGLRIWEGHTSILKFLRAMPRSSREWLAAAPPEVPLHREVAAVIRARQEELGAGPQSIENAKALESPGTLAVVTGQQPGLFGGALLTFHKIAGAVSLARTLDGIGGRRVVPVFWPATEDHDFDEVRCSVLLDRAGQARRLCADVPGGGRSIRDVPLSKEVSDGILLRLGDVLPDTERGRKALQLARRPARADFAVWSITTMLALLGDCGLVVAEPSVLSPFLGGLFARLVTEGVGVGSSIREAGKRLRRAELPAALNPAETDLPLFLREQVGGPRRRLTVPTDEAALPALAEQVRSAPQLVSGDVVGRVLAQNHALPVLAYVAGPSELAYWAQLKQAHERLDVPFPIVLPRPAATWIEKRAAATAEAFGLTLTEILKGEAVPPPSEDPALEAAFEAVRAVVKGAEPASGPLLDRGGEGAAVVRRGLESVEAAWERTVESAREAFAKDRGVGTNRWVRLRDALFPTGKPQERVLSPLSIVARHGVETFRRGLESLDLLQGPAHVVFHLSDGPA
jgi:bacillithiol biosynthesis cysteine-adding enzyme BshC